MNTKVKWHNEDYDLGCDVSKLEELGFTNSSWKDDIAPSYSNDKMQIFFLNKNKFDEHKGRSKFNVNKILDDETIDLAIWQLIIFINDYQELEEEGK